MRKVIALLFLMMTLFGVVNAHARGGQGADDCPPGSTDPDCKGK